MGSHFEEVAAALAEEKRIFVEKWRAEKKRADTAEKERDREKEQAQISEEGFATARLTIAEMVSEKIALEEALAAARRECDLYRHALEQIDRIRNDIIGRQTINWSAHIYPLVAALGEAGFRGMTYEKARAVLAAPADGDGK